MENKKSKNKVSPIGKEEPEFRFDMGTLIFIIIGSVCSWINMLIILDTMAIWAYLSIMFTIILPGVLIGIKNRYWGYGYIFGFSIAGIPFMILEDLFIGGYTFSVGLFIFIILWLIFWKTWRSISKIKT
ncbi:MAG: hypothetical protein EU539_07775 [Promethearchaeota archaeon]|nr:MAG: hypothetical protein EU539_07775 [Candidatus Lokiarchaeota archaeon]